MSNVDNQALLENAAELIDYFEGTLMAKLMEFDIEQGDYDSLLYHVREAKHLQFQNEYNPDAVWVRTS